MRRIPLLVVGAVFLGGCNILLGQSGGDQVGNVDLDERTDHPSTELRAGGDTEGVDVAAGGSDQGNTGNIGDAEENESEVVDQSQSAGSYVNYSSTAVAEATEDEGRAVLFFHANWCPFCKEADKDINNRLGEIPSGVTIIKTDYDTQDELKEKYGVVMQDTWVQIDSEGKMIKKWNGGKLDGVIENVI